MDVAVRKNCILGLRFLYFSKRTPCHFSLNISNISKYFFLVAVSYNKLDIKCLWIIQFAGEIQTHLIAPVLTLKIFDVVVPDPSLPLLPCQRPRGHLWAPGVQHAPVRHGPDWVFPSPEGSFLPHLPSHISVAPGTLPSSPAKPWKLELHWVPPSVANMGFLVINYECLIYKKNI